MVEIFLAQEIVSAFLDGQLFLTTAHLFFYLSPAHRLFLFNWELHRPVFYFCRQGQPFQHFGRGFTNKSRANGRLAVLAVN